MERLANGWFWWIQSVYVREDARRGGVFRALYNAIAEQAAADPTVIGLRLYFETDNYPGAVDLPFARHDRYHLRHDGTVPATGPRIARGVTHGSLFPPEWFAAGVITDESATDFARYAAAQPHRLRGTGAGRRFETGARNANRSPRSSAGRFSRLENRNGREPRHRDHVPRALQRACPTDCAKPQNEATAHRCGRGCEAIMGCSSLWCRRHRLHS